MSVTIPSAVIRETNPSASKIPATSSNTETQHGRHPRRWNSEAREKFDHVGKAVQFAPARLRELPTPINTDHQQKRGLQTRSDLHENVVPAGGSGSSGHSWEHTSPCAAAHTPDASIFLSFRRCGKTIRAMTTFENNAAHQTADPPGEIFEPFHAASSAAASGRPATSADRITNSSRSSRRKNTSSWTR